MLQVKENRKDGANSLLIITENVHRTVTFKFLWKHLCTKLATEIHFRIVKTVLKYECHNLR